MAHPYTLAARRRRGDSEEAIRLAKIPAPRAATTFVRRGETKKRLALIRRRADVIDQPRIAFICRPVERKPEKPRPPSARWLEVQAAIDADPELREVCRATTEPDPLEPDR